MSDKHLCDHSLEQLCDLLEMELGYEAGQEACREVREHIRDCPSCYAEFDSLKKTVKIYKNISKREVPQDVQTRLLIELNFQIPAIDNKES